MNYFSLNVRLFLLLVGKVVVSMKINVYLHPPDYFMYNDEKNWLDILHTTMQGSIKIELVFDNTPSQFGIIYFYSNISLD